MWLLVLSFALGVAAAARNDQFQMPPNQQQQGGGQMPELHVSPFNQDLERNVVSVAGGDLNAGSFIEYWYVDKRSQLWRKHFDKTKAQKMLNNVKFVDTGFDGSAWYIGTDGNPYRLTPEKESGELVADVPDGTRFTRLSPRSYDEALLVSSTGELYHYAMKQFIQVPSVNNAFDVVMGNDGLLLYSTTSGRLKLWNWAGSSWDEYEKKGRAFGANDFQHVIVMDAQNKVKKRVDGRWKNIKQTCEDVSVYSVDEYMCITPDGNLRKIKY